MDIIMKKTTSTVLLLILALSLTLTGCSSNGGGSAKKADVFTAQSCYIEEAYRGDCWNSVNETLILNADNTYVRIENTSIIQAGGVVVTYWTYTATGTYTATEAKDGVRSVTLSAPKEMTHVMNDAVTTSADDASLLEYMSECTLELNVTTFKYTV